MGSSGRSYFLVLVARLIEEVVQETEQSTRTAAVEAGQHKRKVNLLSMGTINLVALS